jgi:hypothetical protein
MRSLDSRECSPTVRAVPSDLLLAHQAGPDNDQRDADTKRRKQNSGHQQHDPARHIRVSVAVNECPLALRTRMSHFHPFLTQKIRRPITSRVRFGPRGPGLLLQRRRNIRLQRRGWLVQGECVHLVR